MRAARRCGSMPSRLVRALRRAALLAFVLASLGSHGDIGVTDALDYPSLQMPEGEIVASPHHAAPCARHGIAIKHGACCLLGQCMIGIPWPPSPPLPQLEPSLPAAPAAPRLVGAEPQTPYRPPA